MASLAPKLKPIKTIKPLVADDQQGILAQTKPALATTAETAALPTAAPQDAAFSTAAPVASDTAPQGDVSAQNTAPTAPTPGVGAPPESMSVTEKAQWYKDNGIAPPANLGEDGVLGTGIIGHGGSGTDFTSPASATGGVIGSDGKTAWTPTTGIIDDIKGIDPAKIEGSSYQTAPVDPATGYTATGYTAQQAPEAQGFLAEGYKPETVKENLSDAVARITDQDGILMQRRGAQAQAAANARGLGNSTMALEAGQAAVIDAATQLGAGDVDVAKFNAQVANDAASFLANWKNTAAQFLAAEKNQNGRFNAEQANQAAAFTANATNQAAALLASAKNTQNLFVAEQANLASRFAAEADMAAKEFNATAYNQAMQRYADAMNAALAAQNDAENLARRDTAQIAADFAKTKMTLGTQQQIATTNAIGAGAAANANREIRLRELDQQMTQFGMQLDQRTREFASTMGASQFSQFVSGLNQGLLTEMEPDARTNWLNNYMSIWNANGGLNFDINMDMFPPAGGSSGGSGGTPSGTGIERKP